MSEKKLTAEESAHTLVARIARFKNENPHNAKTKLGSTLDDVVTMVDGLLLVIAGERERVADGEADIATLREELSAALVNVARLEPAVTVLERNGFRRCDVAACNCGSWHAGPDIRVVTELLFQKLVERAEGAEHELGAQRGELAEVRRLYARAQEDIERFAVRLDGAADPQAQYVKPEELRGAFKELP